MSDPRDNKINYIEIPVQDIGKAKEFFTQLFGWTFQDYGPDYCSFSGAGVDGGFEKVEKSGYSSANSPLVVFYMHDLEAARDKVKNLGGVIVKEIFSFPGGRRFHFTDLNNNEFAVWSEKPE